MESVFYGSNINNWSMKKTTKTPQCRARTLKGQQCAAHVKEGGVLCSVHKKVKPTHLTLMDDEEPWTLLCLSVKTTRYVPFAPLPVQQHLRRLCCDGPSKTDGDGWIYIYDRPNDGASPYYKIGRTKRSPQQRLAEWNEAQLIQSFRTPYHKFAESLLFGFLAPLRMTRQWDPQRQARDDTNTQSGLIGEKHH